jgi:hypothetical protein
MRSHYVLMAAGLFLLAGCSSGTDTHPVSGVVLWEGAPLPHGHVLFEPAEGGAAEPAEVREGRFTLRATPGLKRVQVRATREEGAVDPVMGARPRKQFIPARYNDQTTLEAEVKPGEGNSFEFKLTSAPR